MNKRIQWIDVAKGICMLSVIAGHFGVSKVNNVVYAYHLTVFFLLSGYTLRKAELDKEYLNNKFKTLMMPYFLTCFCVMLMDILNCFLLWHNTTNESITGVIAGDIIRSFWASGSITSFGNVEIGTRIGAVWFLPALFFALVIVQLLLNHLEEKKMQYLVAILLSMGGYITAKFIWLPFSIQSAMMAAPYILLGYDIRQKEFFGKLNIKVFFVCLVAFVMGILGKVSLIVFASADMPDYVLSAVVGLCASICIIYISQKMEWCKPLELIGKYSLYVLCVHLFVLETMWTWVVKLLETFGIYNSLTNFLTQLILIFALTFILVEGKRRFSKLLGKKSAFKAEALPRDAALDVAKGLLIILMIMGHFVVDYNFRRILYSFHMVAFIFYSGMCFKRNACDNVKKSLLKLAKSFLIPYGIFAIIYGIITHDGILTEVKNILCGLSFSKNLFKDCVSIGPVYFILLLFVVRVIYIFVEKYITSEWGKLLAVAVLSLSGYLLGQYGWWLPWSADVALYSVIFYYLGYCLKKYDVIKYISERYYMYFLLSCIWAYMIWKGGMEIAVRQYGNYSIGVAGAVCAAILFYMFSQRIVGESSGLLTRIPELIGKSTIYILMIHTLFNAQIYVWSAGYFSEGHFVHMIIVVCIQVTGGVLASMAVAGLKNLRKNYKIGAKNGGTG